MKGALTETEYIFSILFSEEQKKLIRDFLDHLQINGINYTADILWQMDQEIGGIGGYCMPPDPKINPFLAGV